MKKIKYLFKTTKTKNGTYSVARTVIVLAVVIAANLALAQVPAKYKNIDVSSTQIYEITDTSKQLLKKLDTKVTMTVLANKENADERIKTFLSKYKALSKHLSVKWIDPALHPSALTEYEAEENSIVVACEHTKKKTTVAFADIIVVDASAYYTSGTVTESSFDGEGQLTSAVNYVTADDAQKIYRTTGHGENTLSSSITELMDKNNFTTTELNLVMQATIPEDCELLLMYAPAKDLTEEEKRVVKDYLTKGGKVMLLLGETESAELPVLSSLMKEYGMELKDGYIADPERCYQGNYYYIFPQLLLSGDMAKNVTSEMVLLTNTLGMNVIDPARESITVESFMTTSENAAAVTEEGQTEGMYTLAVTATESITSSTEETADDAETADEKDTAEENTAGDMDGKQSRFTVISAASLIDSQITDTFTQLENATVFMNAVSSNFDGIENISIEPKSLTPEYNAMQHTGLLGLSAIFGLPLLILLSGFVVWFKRRKA